MDFFPEKLRQIWNVWEIRAMILSSLSLQVILILFGSRRKTNGGIPIRLLVWCAYVSADWVATFCLSALATIDANPEDSSKATNSLQSLWAPFLLLHLGGPDTITACSLEDNDLWLRHFLRLLVQVGVAIYVLLRSWSNNALNYLAIPLFVIGIIKYAERTWVLRSSSAQRLKNTFLTEPDPGPDVALALEKKTSILIVEDRRSTMIVPPEDNKSEKDNVIQGNFLFKRLLYLFAGLILGYHERRDSYNIIHDNSPKEAFKIVAVELGFMYDTLYTKASLVYNWLGLIIRCINVCFLASALLAFAIVIDKHAYKTTDIAITYSLFGGSIVLEVYAFILLFFSDWTKLWLTRLKKAPFNSHRGATCPSCPPRSLLAKRKRWSASMGQYNLLRVSLKKPFKCMAVQKCFGVREALEQFNCKTSIEISDDLQTLIFEHLKKKGMAIKDDKSFVSSCKELLARRGDSVLEEYECLGEFKWYTVGVEFDHSLLLWHIATTICYYNDSKKEGTQNVDSRYEISKCLSDYMLYVLVNRQTMLPKGIGEIRYRDTCAETSRFFKGKGISSDKSIKEACISLLDVKVNSLEMLKDIKKDSSQSVLFSGCILAKELEKFENEKGYEYKWKMISEVWVEMVAYAANKCGWKEHGQQLRRGGELLTHVSVLMAHLGLSEQYQIQTEYINQAAIPIFRTEQDPDALVGCMCCVVYGLINLLCCPITCLCGLVGCCCAPCCACCCAPFVF